MFYLLLIKESGSHFLKSLISCFQTILIGYLFHLDYHFSLSQVRLTIPVLCIGKLAANPMFWGIPDCIIIGWKSESKYVVTKFPFYWQQAEYSDFHLSI